MVLKGRSFPPLASQAVDATLVADAGHVRLTDSGGESLASGRLRDVNIEAPVGTAPRRIVFPDGRLFETEDTTSVDELSGITAGRLLHRSERFRMTLIWVVLAAIVGVGLAWRFALPMLVSAAIFLTPPPLIEAIDVGTMQALDKTMVLKSNLSEQRRSEVTELFDQLLEALPEDRVDGTDYNLLFRSMPGVGPNAFALPGGTIVITDALVKQFPYDDVIASVLGHEIGHVEEQHGLRRLYRSLGGYVLIATIAGDTGPILEDIFLEGNVLLSLSHSRGQESAADEFGVNLARNAGFDPAGLLTFFEGLPDTGDSWLSTHPSNKERVETLRGLTGSR